MTSTSTSTGKSRSTTADMDEKTFREDTRTLDAVIRNFQVIGEAVRLIPQRVQTRQRALCDLPML